MATDIDTYRNFEDGKYQDRVAQTYKIMHTNQTLEFSQRKMKEWCQLNHGEYTLMEISEKLDTFVDESDPDINLGNLIHAYQTAEGIRERHPNVEDDWLVFTGFVHDLGKVMSIWGEPQWCVVGDTFPLGCAPQEEIVFGIKSFVDNPDIANPLYNTKLGMYEENCGLENVTMSWGHDEYLYQVLSRNPESARRLPKIALRIIRYHSFYPWHTGGGYRFLMNEEDQETLKWVRIFQKYDLYTKCETLPDLEVLKPYYNALMEKYAPGKLRW